MGLFGFLTENGRGSLAVISKEKLTYEVGSKSSEIFFMLIVMLIIIYSLLFDILSLDSSVFFAPNL